MDQHIYLMILGITVVMTRDYLKCCNAYLLIYRGFKISVAVYEEYVRYVMMSHTKSGVRCNEVNNTPSVPKLFIF